MITRQSSLQFMAERIQKLEAHILESATQIAKLKAVNGERTVHVVLHRNGTPIHFDVTVNFQRLAETLGHHAERNRSHVAVVAGGHVKVEHIP